ncbi:MAG: DNA polymerase I [Candidatus Erginobacter occultus]|nr:DNA polymerase I [Candidatus Erginobacter occultus]
MERLLLIDGMSNAYRAFYAIRGLTTSRGRPTNAVFGFIKILLKIIEEYQPDYLAVAGDAKGPTLRHEEFEDYKAQRKPMPADLAEQLPLIRRAARGYNIPWLEVPGYEADDILAALTARGRERGMRTYILTGDKDMLQLVDETVSVISPHGDGKLFDRQAVEERYGVPPSGVGDVLALMGDQIDNVPGVPGIGEKTAVKLLREYGDLEGVLAHAGEVKNKRAREALLEHGDQARFSRSLVELKAEVPIEVEWEELRRREPDREELRELFEKLEFRQLLHELLPEDGPSVEVRVVSDPDSCRLLAGELEGRGEFAVNPWPDSGGLLNGRLQGLAFCLREGEPVLVDLRDAENRGRLLEILRPLFRREETGIITHDAKRLVHIFLNENIEVGPDPWDTLLASYLLHPSRPEHDLAGLAWSFLGRSGCRPEGKSPTEAETIERLGAEADWLLALKPPLESELKEKGLLDLMFKMELPLSRVLVSMERDGIRLDSGQLRAFSHSLEEELESLTRQMYDLAGEEFNLNSPKQLQKILFEKLGLPPQKKIKTGYSTNVSVLQKLAALHPLPDLLLAYRRIFKLKTTYLDPLPGLIDPETGRIHTTFHQAVTATGRLSSSDPNLQNIPIRGEMGKKVRRAFIPGTASWRFLAADYSQIDLRVLAHLSRDPLLVEAFRENRDIHAFTAAQIFDLPLDQVTPEMRRRAKTVNFGIIYGMGAYGLSQDLKISFVEAEQFIKQYFEKYHGVAEFIEKTIAEAHNRGYVTTIYNRRRYLPELQSDQDSVRRFGERTAVNTPIQGSSSDIIKLAMIEIAEALRREGLRGRLLLQVHDDLLFESPPEEIDALGELVRREMEGAGELSVPLRIDLKTGDNWGDLEKWEPPAE